MSKRQCLLIGGTKMVERHLRSALPSDMQLTVLRSMEQAMKHMAQAPVQLLVFGPTMRRSLAMVGTLRRDKARLEVGLLVVYRDDQRVDVERHASGAHVADAYIMQSKASRELRKAVTATLVRVAGGLGVESELLEELPMEALSPMTGDVSSAAAAVTQAIDAPIAVEELEEIDLLELSDLELIEDGGPDEGDSATQVLDLGDIEAAMDGGDLIEIDGALLEEDVLGDDVLAGDVLEDLGVDIGPFEAETETDLDQLSSELISEIASEEVVMLDGVLDDSADDGIEDLEMDDLEEIDMEELEELDIEELEELALDDLEELSTGEIEQLDANDVALIEGQLEDGAGVVVETITARAVAEKATAAIATAAAAQAAAAQVAAEQAASEKAAAAQVAAEQAASEKAAADKIASEKAAADKIASEKAAADKTAATEPAAAVVPPRHRGRQSSAQFMAENLSELGKMLSTLQEASAEVGRLETENIELSNQVETLRAAAGAPTPAADLAKAEAARAAAEERASSSAATVEAAQQATKAAQQAAESAQQAAEASAAVLVAAEAQVESLKAELVGMRRAAAQRDTAIAAASALLSQAAQHLSGPDVAPVDRS